MSPEVFRDAILNPGMDFLSILDGPPVSANARRMLMAIALQESGQKLEARYQNSPSNTAGPARGWWQFEQGGGVYGVLNHRASKDIALKCCNQCWVLPQTGAVWRALEGHDILAACFARLLLWTDPPPLPVTEAAGWDCYMRVWRPGKPHPHTWPANWAVGNEIMELGA